MPDRRSGGQAGKKGGKTKDDEIHGDGYIAYMGEISVWSRNIGWHDESVARILRTNQDGQIDKKQQDKTYYYKYFV